MNEHDEHLLRGLVGQHNRLYHENAEFHASVNTLVPMVRIWMDALAVRAKTQEADMRAHLEQLMCEAPAPFILRDLPTL